MFLTEARRVIRLFKGYKGFSKRRIEPYRVNDLTRAAQGRKPKFVKVDKLKWILNTAYSKLNLEFKGNPNDPILIATIDNKLTVVHGFDKLKDAVKNGKKTILAIYIPRSDMKPFAKYRREMLKKYNNFWKKK